VWPIQKSHDNNLSPDGAPHMDRQFHHFHSHCPCPFLLHDYKTAWLNKARTLSPNVQSDTTFILPGPSLAVSSFYCKLYGQVLNKIQRISLHFAAEQLMQNPEYMWRVLPAYVLTVHAK
jgi:hypothetical protein